MSFYWAESQSLALAPDLTEQLNPWLACMAGTNQPVPRCRALSGMIGLEVSCTVYAQRPSPCHELQPGEDRCQRARARHGLAPLPPNPV